MDGVAMKIGGREFVVPPANCWAAKTVMRLERSLGQLKADAVRADGGDNVAAIDAVLGAYTDILMAGLAENYPDLSREEMEKAMPGTVARLDALLPEFFRAMGFDLAGDSPGEAQGR